MLKYNEYIGEGLLNEIINENNLCASSDFITKLKSIEDQSGISDILLFLFDKEIWIDKNKQNYINVDGDDTVSFLPDDKYDKLKYSSDAWDVKGRGSIKIGRFLSSILSNTEVISRLKSSNTKSNFSQKDIEEFVNLYKASSSNSDLKFSIIEGNDIKKYYNQDIYSSVKGTLGSSCMRSVGSGFFDIYSYNPESCKMLIYTNSNNELMGRALIWKIEKSPFPDAEWFMDRVYSISDSDINKFKKYANDNGWMYKFKMTSSSTYGMIFTYKGKDSLGILTVKINKVDFEYYPYLDTLPFLDKDKKTLSNNGSIGCSILQSTDGEEETCDDCSGKGIKFCFNCQNSGKVNCIWCDNGKRKCQRCWGTKKVKCDECSRTGFISCKDCEGWGKWKCQTCDGLGGIGQGRGRKRIPCEDCESTGIIECKSCKGTARQKCKDCRGLTFIKCPLCNGEDVICQTCKGIGDTTCPYCRGEEPAECPECVGYYKSVLKAAQDGYISGFRL